MRGDERRRFCDLCSKHVHDLSSMRREDALALLDERAKTSTKAPGTKPKEVDYEALTGLLGGM